MEHIRKYNFGQKFNDNGNIIELIGVMFCAPTEYRCLIISNSGSKSYIKIDESYLKTLPYIN